MKNIYFGGSRNPQSINPAQIAQVVGAVIAAGQAVHVGCQFGADQAVVSSCPRPSLTVFAVHCPYTISNHLQVARVEGARVVFHAGGTSAPMQARYLLRSIAAFQGCAAAVFFNPGNGSLAVAREAHRAGLPVFVFSASMPAAIPSVSGHWVASSFAGFACWQWVAPVQISLF